MKTQRIDLLGNVTEVDGVTTLNPVTLYTCNTPMPLTNSPTLPNAQYGTIVNPNYSPSLDVNLFPNSSFDLNGNFQQLYVEADYEGDVIPKIEIQGVAFNDGKFFTSELIDVNSKTVNYFSVVTRIRLLNNVNVTTLIVDTAPLDALIDGEYPKIFLGPVFLDTNITGDSTGVCLSAPNNALDKLGANNIKLMTFTGFGPKAYTEAVLAGANLSSNYKELSDAFTNDNYLTIPGGADNLLVQLKPPADGWPAELTAINLTVTQQGSGY